VNKRQGQSVKQAENILADLFRSQIECTPYKSEVFVDLLKGIILPRTAAHELLKKISK
jgi:hypothetical protein